jgi:hypothetical protein
VTKRAGVFDKRNNKQEKMIPKEQKTLNLQQERI